MHFHFYFYLIFGKIFNKKIKCGIICIHNTIVLDIPSWPELDLCFNELEQWKFDSCESALKPTQHVTKFKLILNNLIAIFMQFYVTYVHIDNRSKYLGKS